MLNCSGLIFSGLLVRFRKNSDHQYKPSASNKTEPISRSNTHFERHSFPSSPIKSAAVRDVLFHKCLYQTLCFLILTDDPETIKDSLWLPLAASEQSHPHVPPSYRPCSIKMPGRNLTLPPQTLCTRCWLRSRAALRSPPPFRVSCCLRAGLDCSPGAKPTPAPRHAVCPPHRCHFRLCVSLYLFLVYLPSGTEPNEGRANVYEYPKGELPSKRDQGQREEPDREYNLQSQRRGGLST